MAKEALEVEKVKIDKAKLINNEKMMVIKIKKQKQNKKKTC